MTRLGRRTLIGGAAATLALGALGCAPEATRLRASGRRSLVSRAVEQLVEARRSVDGAGVSLTRHTAAAALEALDPFVLLDEIHSSDPADYARGFPSHPHRGFETVSIMLSGRFRHRDSHGGGGVVVPGGAQWMTAGSGIVHSEMPETDPAGDTELWGFQLWVNLPRAQKWQAPGYQELGAERMGEVTLDRGGQLRVIAGELLGARGPVAPRTTEPVLATLRLGAGDDVELRLPREHAAFVLAAEGSPAIGPRSERVPEGALAKLTPGELVRVRSDAGAQLLVLAGAPIREPIAHGGPFVMNTEREIEQAFADYRAGRLG